jgi:hypothetical protein
LRGGVSGGGGGGGGSGSERWVELQGFVWFFPFLLRVARLFFSAFHLGG